MVDNKVVVRIAQKIRSTRLSKNMTIQQLATRSKVSKGLLSKIENARTVPSLPVFVTLIQSLDISLKEFFNDMLMMSSKNYLLIKRDQFSSLQREDRIGFHYEHILSQTLTSSTMEAVLLTVEPGARSIPSTTDGFEFKYLIAGSCNYMINDEIVTLEEGDALFFNGAMPHVPVNITRRKAVMLVLYFLNT